MLQRDTEPFRVHARNPDVASTTTVSGTATGPSDASMGGFAQNLVLQRITFGRGCTTCLLKSVSGCSEGLGCRAANELVGIQGRQQRLKRLGQVPANRPVDLRSAYSSVTG